MTETPVGFAHGKAILIGEHAVVHGTPAIAMPVGMGVEVELGLDRAVSLNPAFLQWFAELARTRSGEAWLPARIGGDLPMGVGLGSSAALSLAALRALATRAPLDEAELAALADEAERIFHGRPSGLDVQAVLAGRALRVCRTDGALETLPARVGADFAFDLWITPPGPSTADMVALVSERLEAAGREAALAQAKRLVEAAATALAAGDAPALGAQMQGFHHWLRRFGAGTPIIEDLVAHALALGASGAKITGAGGGGAVLVLWPDQAPETPPLPPAVRRFSFVLAADPVETG